ncbi:unnamed protein product, partial [marine sediment metagenome]
KLLVYLESVQVNKEERFDREKLTSGEELIMNRWIEEGLIKVGRLHLEQSNIRGRNKRVKFLRPELWGIAWAFRKEMSERFGYPWKIETVKEKSDD